MKSKKLPGLWKKMFSGLKTPINGIPSVFFILVLFYMTLTIHRTTGVGGGLFNLLYHLHTLHEHLHISWAITAETSPLHMVSGWTKTWSLWFLSANL